MIQQATLYLMVGYPGSGKTTVSRIIQRLTGARHIWADQERRQMFGRPSHSHQESQQLYDQLNAQTDNLLEQGISVIFDTNFNFRVDRDRLRAIATRHGAGVKLVWVQVPQSVAQQRATAGAHLQSTRVLGDIPLIDFQRMVGNLQPPQADEQPIILDGTIVTDTYVTEKLGLQKS